VSEQPSGQGWLGDFGRERYPSAYSSDEPGWPSYQQARSQPPWEQDPTGAPSWDADPGAPGGPPSPGPGQGQPTSAAGQPAAGRPAPGQPAPGQPAPGQPAPGAGQAAAGAGGGRSGTAAWALPGRGARSGKSHGSGPHRTSQHSQLPLGEGRDFLHALLDLRFTSFVTPKIVKVTYVLVMVVTALGALAFAISMLAVDLFMGLLVLVIGVPLAFLMVTALCRVMLEFFMVVFRMAEDIRTLRERGGDLN
jgi:Domain of unknown function (DUF4282)